MKMLLYVGSGTCEMLIKYDLFLCTYFICNYFKKKMELRNVCIRHFNLNRCPKIHCPIYGKILFGCLFCWTLLFCQPMESCAQGLLDGWMTMALESVQIWKDVMFFPMESPFLEPATGDIKVMCMFGTPWVRDFYTSNHLWIQ